jgi:hypothetical protein
MKKAIKLFTFSILSSLLIFSCGSNNVDSPTTPASNTGTISAKFNGTDWNGTWATSLIANLGNIQVLTMNAQISEKNTSELVGIGISSFTSIGTYNFGGVNDKASLDIKYKGKNYSANTLYGGGGTGTIKITEFVKANGILNPGKAVGEFSGTIKSIDSNDVLTITSGKFNSIIVL